MSPPKTTRAEDLTKEGSPFLRVDGEVLESFW